MIRECKNCQHHLYEGQHFCAQCGAKWIERRITMKHVAQDFGDLYLGLDTRFFRTFIDLFRRPAAVINGYIHGRRMNYMDAIRYFLLALFVTGIYALLLKKMGYYEGVFEDMNEMYAPLQVSGEQLKKSKEMNAWLLPLVTDFQGFILMLTIPLYAIAARITFWGKKYYNFTEQLVFYLYAYGHMVIATTPISIFILFVFPETLMTWSSVGLLFIFGYAMYAYTRCLSLSWSQVILKAILSILVMLALLVAFAFVGFFIALLFVLIVKING